MTNIWTYRAAIATKEYRQDTIGLKLSWNDLEFFRWEFYVSVNTNKSLELSILQIFEWTAVSDVTADTADIADAVRVALASLIDEKHDEKLELKKRSLAEVY